MNGFISSIQPDQALSSLLEWSEQAYPQRRAIRFEGQAYSYGQMAQATRQCASWLWHALQVRPGQRVAYLGYNHVDQLLLLFALARIGAALVPINYRLAPTEWQNLLADCQPAWLLHDEAWATQAQEICQALGAVTGIQSVAAGGWQGHTGVPEVPAQGAAASPVLLVYTSGTTGEPKGAVHTQANLLANMAIAAQVQAMDKDDVIVTVLPLFHVGGLCIQTLPALAAGACVILHGRFDAALMVQCLREDRPSLTLQVPATLRALVQHPDWAALDLGGLRAIWAGSSVLPQDLVEIVQARGVPVCNVYGATETGPFSIALSPDHAFTHVGSCGWPAPGVEVQLLAVASPGSSGDGQVGEICLRAPNVVNHYWPDKPCRDAQGWFHTGDLACRSPDGSYRVVGRAKDMVISGGENIYPAEVENALNAHPAVLECAVLGMPDARWGEKLVAAVVFKPDCVLSDGELLAHLSGRLARYKLPRQFFSVDSLPKTALGKVQKPVLLAQLQSLPRNS